MKEMILIDINSIPDPETGKTTRETNMEKQHNIPLKTLVETDSGLRLFVVEHQRDFDGTPLYGLSFDENWSIDMFGEQFIRLARTRVDGGYPEECLQIFQSYEDYVRQNNIVEDNED